jgi:hypothetical protein
VPSPLDCAVALNAPLSISMAAFVTGSLVVKRSRLKGEPLAFEHSDQLENLRIGYDTRRERGWEHGRRRAVTAVTFVSKNGDRQ